MDTIQSILNWFKLAKPNPTAKDISTQIGCHYEEVAEFAIACNDDISAQEIKETADWYKAQKLYVDIDSGLDEKINSFNRLEVADALCDQIVTALGVGYMLGIDMSKALDEVNRSNYSKFENGRPIFNEYGKIMKGSNYTKPNLKPFISEGWEL